MIMDIDGDIFYLNNGILENLDGPAIEYCSGNKCWMFDGKIHRENGPAILKSNGIKEYWLNGERASFEEIKNIKRNMWMDKILLH